jgi:hypothetical protein
MTPLALAAWLATSQVQPAAAPPAAAQTARPTAAARKEAATRYARAIGLYKEGNVSAALAEFKAAHAAVPGHEVLFNMGLCQRRLFQYGQAIATFERYLSEGGAKVPADRRAAVAEEVRQIRELTAPVAVIVQGAPARVLVDGEPVGETPLASFLLLGPGRHVVRAEREGCLPAEKTVETVSGQSQAVELSPVSLTAPGRVTVECTPSGARVSVDGAEAQGCPVEVALAPGTHELLAQARGHAQLRTEVVVQPAEPRTIRLTLLPLPPAEKPFPAVATALLGTGLVAAATGAVFAWRADDAAKQVTALAATGGTWDARAQSLQASGKRDERLGWGLLLGGAAVASAGVAALVVHQVSTPSVDVALGAGPTGVFAAGRF